MTHDFGDFGQLNEGFLLVVLVGKPEGEGLDVLDHGGEEERFLQVAQEIRILLHAHLPNVIDSRQCL